MIRAFLRAFLIVSLTAANVSLIAERNWIAMFLTGTALSYTWWGNTKTATKGGRSEQVCYALGAGCGTITGVILASVL